MLTKKIVQFVVLLPQHKWLYKVAMTAFFLLVFSFLLTTYLTSVFEPQVGCWARMDILTFNVHCNGFSFAETVEAILKLFVNLWVLSLLLPILLFSSFVGGDISISNIILLLTREVGLFILDVLAFLYFLHILVLGWRWIKSSLQKTYEN